MKVVSVLALALPIALAAAACVGDDAAPVVDAGSDSGLLDSGAGVDATQADTGADATPDSAIPVTDAASDAAIALDAGPVDSGPPSVACSTDTAPTNTANMRCSASAAQVTPGTAISSGTYILTRAYGAVCNADYIYGHGTVFSDNGNLFFRWRIRTTTAAGTSTDRNGTYYLSAAANGDITRTEVCEALTKGTKETGIFSQAGGTLTFTMGANASVAQTGWTRQ